MKKYVKPELFFESFELSQQIAACQYDLDESTHGDLQCQFVGGEDAAFPGVSIFTDGCVTDTEDYCVHNGSDLQFNVFNS